MDAGTDPAGDGHVKPDNLEELSNGPGSGSDAIRPVSKRKPDHGLDRSHLSSKDKGRSTAGAVQIIGDLREEARESWREGEVESALEALEQAKSLYNRKVQNKPVLGIELQLLQAEICLDADYEQAANAAFIKVFASLSKLSQTQEIEVIALFVEFADSFFDSAYYDEAERLYKKAFELVEGHADEYPLLAVTVSRGLANLYYSNSEFLKAYDLVVDILATERELDSTYRVQVLSDEVFRAEILEELGQANRAGQIYHTCVAQLCRVFSYTGDTEVLDLVIGAADKMIDCGAYPDLLAKTREDLGTVLKGLDESSKYSPELLQLMGLISHEMGEIKEAVQFSCRALELLDGAKSDHAKKLRGDLYLQLAETHLSHKHLDASKEPLRRAERIFTALSTDHVKHPTLAMVYALKGHLANLNHDYDEAAEAFNESGELFDTVPSGEYSYLKQAKLTLAKAKAYMMMYCHTSSENFYDGYETLLADACDILYDNGLTAHRNFEVYHKLLLEGYQSSGQQEAAESIACRIELARWEAGEAVDLDDDPDYFG